MPIREYDDSWKEVLTKRYERFCNDLDAIGPDGRFDSLSEALDNYTGIGGGESGTAGAHQERELLELLQNGRDAIETGEGSGTLYVAVSEEGVLVANTGAPFDFTDGEVLEDLWKVNRSRKPTDAIGEKGVGLTSVCTVGDAYEVWTRLDPNGEDELARLRCGPINPTAGLLARTEASERGEVAGHLDRFVDALAGDRLRNHFVGEMRDRATLDVSRLRSEDVADLPFFHYPLPLVVPKDRADAGSPLEQAAMQLLVDASKVVDGEGIPDRFTTAVIIHFDDEDLTAFQDALGVDASGRDWGGDEQRLEEDLWTRLRHKRDRNPYGDTRGEVTPESLIHFGNVDHLIIDRLEQLSLEEREQWTIETGPSRDIPADGSAHRPLVMEEVTVDIRTPTGEEDTRTYDHFRWREDHEPVVPEELVTEEQRRAVAEDEEVRSRPRLLIPKNASAPSWLHERSLETVLNGHEVSGIGPETYAYHPYLYYPITGSNRKFPFCLHANFEVTTDREKLRSQSDRYNAEVLDASASLIGDVVTATGRRRATDGEGVISYPWNLLPPVPSDEVTAELESIATGEATPDDVSGSLIDLFCDAVYREIRERRCLLTADDRTDLVSFGEALLHENRKITAAFASAQVIGEQRFVDGGESTNPADDTFEPRLAPLPLAVLLAYLRWGVHGELNTTGWTSRYEHLLEGSQAGEDQVRLDTFLNAWRECLRTQLVGDAPHVPTRAVVGQALFEGTAALLAERTENGDVGDVIDESFDVVGDGVYLLPCESELIAEDGEPMVQLVPVERHAGGLQSSGTYTRTVFWRGDEAPETDLPIPLREIGLHVHVVDEAVSEAEPGRGVLAEVGNEWGIVQLRSYPQYVRELLGSTQRQRGRDGDDEHTEALSMDALEFFADAVAREEQDKLDPSEGAFLGHDNLEKHTYDAERRSRLLNRLVVRRNSLTDACLTDATEPQRLADVRLGPEWQRILRADSEGAVGWTAVEEIAHDVSIVAVEPSVPVHVVEKPASDVWLSLADAGINPQTIAKLLGLLGLSVLPGLEALVLGELPKPDRSRWNPSTWSTTGTGGLSQRQARLQEALEIARARVQVGTRGGDAGSYLDYISAPEHGPGATAGHSDNCNLRGSRGRYTDTPIGTPPAAVSNEFDGADIGLESWVWLPATSAAPDPFDRLGLNYVVSALASYGSAMKKTVLTTGWSCRYHHSGKHGWTDTVPTLLNWQLRHSAVWDDVDEVRTPDWWHGSGIGCAVERGGRGSSAHRWFPTVDLDESSIDADVWQALDIRLIEELSPSAAAYRLQRLQQELAVSTLPSPDDPDPFVRLDELSIEESNEGWQTVYTRLIEPIDDYLRRSENHSLGELPYLTHMPVKMGEHWSSVPLTTLQNRKIKWYSDTQQLPWEDRTGAVDGPWVMATTREGRGTALARVLDCEIIQRTRDRPELAPDVVRAHAEHDGVLDDQFRELLSERRPLIIAALSAEVAGQPYQESHVEKFDAAIDHLRGIPGEDFDEYHAQAGLEEFGRGSAIYPIENGEGDGEATHGLVYSRAAVDSDDPNPTIFTDALRILFRRSRSTDIRLALRADEETLARDLPIAEVRRALGQESVEALRADLNAIASLLNHTDAIEDTASAVDPDSVTSLLEANTGRTVRQEIGESIKGEGNIGIDPTLPQSIEETIILCRSAPSPVRELAHRIISGAADTTAGRCPCQELPGDILESTTFLDWAGEHEHDFEAHWPIHGGRARRLDLISTIWWNADDETRATKFQRIDGWEQAVREGSFSWSWDQPPHSHRFIRWIALDAGSSTEISVDTPWLAFDPWAVEPLQERLLDELCGPGSSGSAEPSTEGIADGGGSPALREALREYIETERFPGTHDSIAEADEQTERIRRRASELVSEGGVDITASAVGADGDVGGFQSRSGQGVSGGGGSLTVRSEFAEEAAFASVCTRLDQWAASMDNWKSALGTRLDSIVDADSGPDWHNPNRCTELNDVEAEGWALAERVLADVREARTLRSGNQARLLLVAADERGPGYDILDMTGHVAGTASDDGLEPTPMEIKAVTGEPPYRVRFTVNEFRKALSFARHDVPYRIQLIRLDARTLEELGPETVSMGPGTTFTTPGDIYEQLPDIEIPDDIIKLPDAAADVIVSMALEQIVRGGYLNLGFDGGTGYD